MKKTVLFLFIPVFAYGITIQQALEIGLKNNNQLKSYRQEIKISEFQLKEDKQLFMPFFSGEYRYTWLNKTPYTSIPAKMFPFPFSFKQTEKNFYNFNLGVGYFLYTGGYRPAKIKISKLGIKEAKYQYKEQENQIKTQIKKAYYDVLMAKSVVDIYKKELKAVEAHLKTVEGFYQEGLTTKVEVLQAKVRLSEVKRDLRKALGDLNVAKSRLSVLIGKGVDWKFSVESINEPVRNNIHLDYLIEKAIRNRALIKEIQIKEKKLKKVETVYKSQFLPKVSLTALYTKTDQYPYLTPKDNYGIALDIKVEFQGIKPYYSILKTKETQKKIRFILRDVKEKVALEVKAAYENLQTAIYNLKVSTEALKQAEEYYRMVVEQYKNQLATGTDVLDAEASLTRARKGKEISYYRYLKALAELEKAVGGDL